MRIRSTHLVLPAYLLATLVYTWPVASVFFHAIPASGVFVDAPAQAFLLGWDGQALAHHPSRIFDVPIFHPERNTLTYMDHLIGEAVIAAPLLAAFPSVAPAYNFLVFFSFALSAWGTYRLTRLFGVARAAAILAGFLYAFSSYRFANLDQLNQLQTEWFPLALFFAIRFLRRGRVRDFAGMAAVFLAQIYFGWYYTFYLALALALLVGYGLVRGLPRLEARQTLACVGIALAVVALALPVTLPYLREHEALPEFQRSLRQAELYSASVLDYLRINPQALLARWLPAAVGYQAYAPGLVTAALAAVGLVALFRKRAPREWREGEYFLVLVAVAFVLSLGPYLHVAGRRIVALPYLWLYEVAPGFTSMRAPGRLASLTLLGLVVLAALGYETLRRRGAGRTLPVLAFAIAVIGAWQLPVRTLVLPTADRLPPVYAWLARQPAPTPILELPATAEQVDESEPEILEQYYVLYHGKPRLDGASGFVSQRYRRFRGVMRQFPDEASVAAAARMGAELVIVHFDQYEPSRRAEMLRLVEQRPELKLVAAFGTDRVYRLETPGA